MQIDRELARVLVEAPFRDLAARAPWVQTVAVVPVGLTDANQVRGAHKLKVPSLTNQLCTPDYARAMLQQVEPYRREFTRSFANPIVFPSDEYYLIAGEAFDWLALAERLLTAAGVYAVTEAALWAALPITLLTPLLLSAARHSTFLSIEAASLIGIFASVFADHREGSLHRPYFITDWLLERNYDPLPFFLGAGAALERDHRQREGAEVGLADLDVLALGERRGGRKRGTPPLGPASLGAPRRRGADPGL